MKCCLLTILQYCGDLDTSYIDDNGNIIQTMHLYPCIPINFNNVILLICCKNKICQLSSVVRGLFQTLYNIVVSTIRRHYPLSLNTLTLWHYYTRKVNNNKLSCTIRINITVHHLCSITLSQGTCSKQCSVQILFICETLQH